MSGPILLILRFLLAAVLYAFLGGTLLILWRDLARQRELLSAARPTLLALQLADQSTRQFTQAVIIIGRDPACDLCFDDPTISAQHARLSYHHNQWWVEDLRSKNGTLLNDESLATATVITHGDVIRCGGIAFTIVPS